MKKYDKLIMGTIIGGAIGSVLGVLFAPKAGKELRTGIKNKSLEVYKKGQEMGQKIAKEHHVQIKKSKSWLKALWRKIIYKKVNKN